MVAFLLSAVVSSALTPVSDSSAQTITVENTATGYYVSVTSPDTVELEVDATPVGQTVVSSTNTINVKTNAPLGYKLYLSTENDELTSTDSSITQTFKPVTSTSLSVNTWGFSTDSTATKNWLAVPEVTSGNESSGYLLSSSATPNIPDGDNINVYYGINSDTTMPSGTYTTTVTYTAIGDGIPEEHTMQEFTVADCANMDTDSNFYLIDSRDNKIYKMVKARDGNCWMAENLKYKNTESSDWSDNNYSEQRLHIATNEGYEGEYYYNYPSAVSVCPTSWSLPSGPDASVNGSWAHLMSVYGITTSNQLFTQTNLGFSGYYGAWEFSLAKEYNQGQAGPFWTSSVPATVDRAYAMVYYYNDGGVTFPSNPYRAGGKNVRCVYQPTMQSLTTEECAKLDLEKTVLLTDTRDNKQYKAARLKDGNCWMQQNLALDGGRTLTPADSDVTSNVTLPANITKGVITNRTSVQIINNLSGYDGNLYNWCAAISIVGDCNNITSEATTSICPKNWRLPSGSGNPSYPGLFSYYDLPTSNTTGGSYIIRVEVAPLLFSRAGWYEGTSYGGQGEKASYWTSTPLDTGRYSYYFYYDSGGDFYPSTLPTSAVNRSVRCLAPGA